MWSCWKFELKHPARGAAASLLALSLVATFPVGANAQVWRRLKDKVTHQDDKPAAADSAAVHSTDTVPVTKVDTAHQGRFGRVGSMLSRANAKIESTTGISGGTALKAAATMSGAGLVAGAVMDPHSVVDKARLGVNIGKAALQGAHDGGVSGGLQSAAQQLVPGALSSRVSSAGLAGMTGAGSGISAAMLGAISGATSGAGAMAATQAATQGSRRAAGSGAPAGVTVPYPLMPNGRGRLTDADMLAYRTEVMRLYPRLAAGDTTAARRLQQLQMELLAKASVP